MGNCCCPQEPPTGTTVSGNRIQAFQGQGQRLGTADEQRLAAQTSYTDNPDENLPKPSIDANLTEEERAKIRADRAAAAEARLKKQGGPPKKPKKTDTPLTGPGTQPLMRWTAG